jgi:Ca2+-binding RTX toxin-like protein
MRGLVETSSSRLELNEDGTARRKYDESQDSDSRIVVRTTLGLVVINAFLLAKNVFFSSDQAQAKEKQLTAGSSGESPGGKAVEPKLASEEDAEQGDGGDAEPIDPEVEGGRPGSGTSLRMFTSPPVNVEPELAELRYNRGSGRHAGNDNEALYGAPPGNGVGFTNDSFSAWNGSGGGHGSAGGGGQPGDHVDPHDEEDDDETDNHNPHQPEAPRQNRLPSVLAPVILGSLVPNEARALTQTDLLQGATDADGDTLSVRSITASSGKVFQNPNGGWVFTPEANDTSSVTFRYFISDGKESIIQTATLDLVPRTPEPIAGSSGSDHLIGTPNDDAIYGYGDNDQIDGRAGNDLIYGGDGNDQILGGDGNDVIYAGKGNDAVFAGRGNDVVFGEEGDDFIDGEEGNDTLVGGAGRDTVLGGEDQDLLDGGADADDLKGEAGNDTLLGGGGHDAIDGGEGDDNASGGSGNDALYMGSGNDTILAEGGDNDDSYDGGDGIDTYDTSGTSSDTTIDLTEGTAASSDTGTDALSSIENIITGAGDDHVVGNSEANAVNAGPGADAVALGAGDDTAVVRPGDGNDSYDGGAGTDTYDASALTADVDVDLSAEHATSADGATDTIASFESAKTGSGDDTVTGTDGANCVETGAGDDAVCLGGGSDVAHLGQGDDTVIAQAGDDDDEYTGGSGSDTYNLSSTSADALIDLISERVTSADVGTDIVIGFENVRSGRGDDRIIASDATNVIVGGEGDDRFEFHSSASIGHGRGYRDKILDFESGDRIDIDKIRDEFADDLSDSFEDKNIERFAIVNDIAEFSRPGQLKVKYESFEEREVTVLQGNTDFDADAEFELELAGHYVLTDNDFYRA